MLRDAFLPDEPPEHELGVVELAHGRGTLSKVQRSTELGKHRDITEHGGWRAYRAGLDGEA